MVDIMPTIARFMEINIPLPIAREVDGVPLIGNLSLTNPSIDFKNQQAVISWKAESKKGKVRIWAATTNDHKTGGNDEYRLLKKTSLRKGKATVDLKDIQSPFYKIILEGKNNTVNRWIVEPQKEK
jgi:hypothetical protein